MLCHVCRQHHALFEHVCFKIQFCWLRNRNSTVFSQIALILFSFLFGPRHLNCFRDLKMAMRLAGQASKLEANSAWGELKCGKRRLLVFLPAAEVFVLLFLSVTSLCNALIKRRLFYQVILDPQRKPGGGGSTFTKNVKNEN